MVWVEQGLSPSWQFKSPTQAAPQFTPLFPSWVKSALAQGVSTSERCLGQTHPAHQDTGSLPRRPSLLSSSGFPGKDPFWSWRAVQWCQRKYPTWQRTVLQIASKRNSLACPIVGPRIWWVLRTHSKRDSCCCKVKFLFWIWGCLWTRHWHDGQFRCLYKCGETYRTSAPRSLCKGAWHFTLRYSVSFFFFFNFLVLNIPIKMQMYYTEESPWLRCCQLIS